MKRLLFFIIIAVLFILSWLQLNEIELLVIGQPSSTGLLQSEKEAPFFNDLRAITHIPFKVIYKPLEAVGFKDTYQLQMLKDGVFDLVSLRFIQNSEIEPSLQGIDLVGLNPDYETAEKVIHAYYDTVDRYLQEKFNAKLLGVWTFGPQELFCIKPIKRLEDIKGLKVRVASRSLSTFISDLGGTPAIISFDETKDALATGLLDCAVTSASSANFAGWPEYARYYFPLSIHFGLNGYAISLIKWNALSVQKQEVLKKTFDAYSKELWQYTKDIYIDAFQCNTGGECKHGKRYDMSLVEPSQHDIELLREITMHQLLPEWQEKCLTVHPDCAKEWNEKISGYFYQSVGIH